MPERSQEDQMKKLFIGGLTYTTTDDKLKEFYSRWGEVVDCVVMRDPQTKRSRGFGFVTFAEQSQLDDAMNNRPHEIDGKTVEPKRAVPREFSNKPENHLSVKKLYVSGIKEEHTEEQLRDYFTNYGAIENVDIIVDKATGNKRGFAFVVFEDYDPVDKCVLEKSHMIGGRRCDVKKALSKEEMRKLEQQERERMERDTRSRGSARGGGSQGGWQGGDYGQNQQWGNNWGPSQGGGWSSGGWGQGGAGDGYGQGGYGGGGYGGGYGGSGYGGGGYGGGYSGGYGGSYGQGGWASGGGQQGAGWGQGAGSSWGGQAGGWGQSAAGPQQSQWGTRQQQGHVKTEPGWGQSAGGGYGGGYA